MRYIAIGLVLLLLSGPTLGQNPQASIEKAVEQVRAAHRSKDTEALAALAAREAPEPWLVADELCGRGEFAAALAFAAAGRWDDGDELAKFARSQRERPTVAAARRTLREADRASGANDSERVLDLVGPRATGTDVCAIRTELLRAAALIRLRRFGDAALGYENAQKVALVLGWRNHSLQLLHQQAVCLSRASAVPRALEAWKSQLQLAERWNRPKTAISARTAMAYCYRKLGRLDDALAVLVLVREECERISDRKGLGSVLTSLGNTLGLLGRSEEALVAYRRALGLYEELADRAAVARLHNNLGIVHKRLGDYPEALESYRRSLRIKKAMGDRRGVAITLGNMGTIYKRLGAYPKAVDHQLRAIEELEAVKDHLRVAGFTTNLGNTYRRLGELDSARTCIRRSLAMSRELKSPLHELKARNALGLVAYDLGQYAEAFREFEDCLTGAKKHGYVHLRSAALNNLGLIHQALGDQRAALEVLKESYAIKAKEGDRKGMASSLANMANAYEALGDLDSALSHFERARKIHEELGAAVSLAWDLGEIGGVLRRMGRPEQAEAKHRKALKISRDKGDRPGEICSLRHLAADLEALGKPGEARRVLEDALATADGIGGSRHVAEVLFRLSSLELSMGDAEAAIAHARRAVSEVSRSAGGLAGEQGVGVRERFLGVFDTGLLAAARLEDPEQFSYFLESGRAGALLEMLGGRNRLRSFLVPEPLRVSLQECREAESIEAHLLSRARRGGNKKEIRTRWASLDRARVGVRKIIERIQREAKAASDVLYREPAALAAVRSFAGAGDAMVLYALTRSGGLAFVVTKDRARIISLGGSDAIRSAVAALSLGNPKEDPGEALRNLRKRLVTPLGLAGSTRRLLVSPHDVLSEVPFALLTDLEVAYVPSATTLGLLLSERGPRGEKVLALADPDYGTAPAAAPVRRGGRLSPLPATRAEAKAVGDVVLLGRDATEARLAAAIGESSRWRAVHLACHGVIDTERPAFSSLAVTPDPDNDGLLTCLEVFRMRIPADLVVLSACETARGKVYRSEGIVGLTRAFMMAGTPRVICSLWKVDDEATKALMLKFYEEWKPGRLGAAAALKRAQRHVADQPRWKHPFYWAAWQLWGLPD